MRIRLGVAVLVALLCCVSLAADEPTYEFHQNYHEGQQFSVLFSSTLDLSYRGNYHGRVLPGTYKYVDAVQDKGLLTIMQTADGVPVAERIDLDAASGSFIQSTGEQPKQEYRKLAGKSVLVRRQPDGVVSCEVDGSDDPRLARTLENWLDRDEELYPDEPVHIKDKWDLSAKLARVIKLTNDQRVLSFCRLASVQNVKGKSFARLMVSMALVGTHRKYKTLHLEVQMEGPAWVDLSNGCIVKLDLQGDVHASGTMPVPLKTGGVVEINAEGDGKAEYHQVCVPVKAHSDRITADTR